MCLTVEDALQAVDVVIRRECRRHHPPACVGVEDLEQEARIAFVQSYPTSGCWTCGGAGLPDTDKARGWAKIVTRRRVIDVIRRTRWGGRLHPDAVAPTSLSALVQDAENAEVGDMIAGDPDAAGTSAVDAAISRLDPRVRLAVRGYLAGYRGVEIGRWLGVTDCRVSQLLGQARRSIAHDVGIDVEAA